MALMIIRDGVELHADVHNSTSVTHISFNNETNEIQVTFKSGTIYGYEASVDMWDNLVAADSIGRFVSMVMRPQLRYKEIK